MSAKEDMILLSFRTTTEAFVMEDSARAAGLEGRLIPLPRSISASCGLCWREPAKNERALLELAQARGIRYDKLYRMTL